MMNFTYQPIPQIIPVVEPKEIRALMISDSHAHGEYLNSFIRWIKTTKPVYDMVFVLGNMANMVDKLRNDQRAEFQAAEQLASTIQCLNDHIQKPIFLVPGNTEPTGCFSKGLEIHGSVNINKRAVQLEEDLIMIGLGGAVPKKKISESKDQALEGYPYQSEEELEKDLTFCVESATATFGSNASYLLLTHQGPTESQTSDLLIESSKINSGSKGFAKLASKPNLIGIIHGHSATSEGITKPFGPSLPVINPGGLVVGHFGEITLRRDATGKWKVGSVELRNLD